MVGARDGTDNHSLEITSSQKPPLTTCLKQLLRVSSSEKMCDGLGILIGLSHPSTILHPARGVQEADLDAGLPLIFVGIET